LPIRHLSPMGPPHGAPLVATWCSVPVRQLLFVLDKRRALQLGLDELCLQLHKRSLRATCAQRPLCPHGAACGNNDFTQYLRLGWRELRLLRPPLALFAAPERMMS
jgi:hypothetical protein